jgi:hypothetical protein
MQRTRTLYHALAVAALIGTAPALAAEQFSYDCDGTTITMACEGADQKGSCTTVTASDPTWKVTCKGHDKGNARFIMDCRNATDVGGSPVELEFSANQLGEQLAEGIGDSTGTTCNQTQ